MPSSKDIDSTEKQNKDNMVRKGNNKYYRRRELLVSKKVFRRTICLYKGLEMNSWQQGYLINTSRQGYLVNTSKQGYLVNTSRQGYLVNTRG